MNKEFVPYEEALALKELGFKKDCLGFYDEDKELDFEYSTYKTLDVDELLAPLYSQAFRWFRKKHKLDYDVTVDYDTYYWDIFKSDYSGETSLNPNNYETYDKAQLACLRRLIEIVKEKKSLKTTL